MAPLFAQVLLGLYVFTLLGMCVFGLHKVKMLWYYLRGTGRNPEAPARPLDWDRSPPRVCIQLPLFNEPLVVEALLETVTAIRWPAGALEIQVLDDSTDDTPLIIERWLKAHPGRASQVQHIRREDRSGYKAGALAYAMTQTEAEFFAIFDADFRPEPNFLETMMPHFAAADVGVVQARWEFNNRNASLLTRFQGIFLDAHFVVEQTARHSAGFFFNFNGTAGIWRRAALDEAGGWTPDTVTEDLDVSYRAQLQGWRFVYLPHYAVASELPQNLTAFKSQQRRWTKGGMQVMRKQMGTILFSDISARLKLEAASHLMVGFIHPLLALFSIIFVPYLLFGSRLTGAWTVFNPVFVLLTSGATVALYVSGQFFRRREWGQGAVILVASPLVLAFGLAMSVTCSLAVIEGLCARGGEFVRTPKGGRAISTRGLLSGLRSRTLFIGITVIELVLGAGMLVGSIHFNQLGLVSVALILLLKATGFIGLALISTRDLLPRFGPASA